jgi:hypothetical protein
MGFWRQAANLLYITNPLPVEMGEYISEKEYGELPALPDFSQRFSQYTAFGGTKKRVDIRFPVNGSDNTKKCQINFAVWRQCLFEHSGESFDEEDPNAKICKKYQKLALHTCPTQMVTFFFSKQKVEHL